MKANILRGILVAAVLSTTSVGAAWAHSKGKTEPADGATVKAVENVVMRFDKPMRLTVFNLTRDGNALDVERSAGMEPVTEFTATPATPLPSGAYDVEWRGLSADGHPMNGAFSFTVAE